jgi:hypothetical protein
MQTITEILGSLPGKDDCLYQVSMCYERWTQDAIEHGDTYDRGYVYCDEWISYGDLLNELNEFTAEGLSSCPFLPDAQRISTWITSQETNFATGVITNRSLHLQAIKIPALMQPDDYLRHGLRYDRHTATNADFFYALVDAGVVTKLFWSDLCHVMVTDRVSSEVTA